MKDPAPDTPDVRRKGWGRTVLFSQFLQPEKVEASIVKDWPALLAWEEGWEKSWERVKDRLFVSPVVQVLVFSQAPNTVMKWVNSVCEWPFQQIVPAHFKAPVKAGPREFREAFNVCFEGTKNAPDQQASKSDDGPFGWLNQFLRSSPSNPGYKIGLPADELAGDFETLRSFERIISATGFVKSPKEG
mmetsp:Transcript_6033/g.11106  ORF Transcript_6033/g.11106 Transcript_6033/m.11106 type:complete len:188 (+) Transcript_6033:480-1043(+)